MLEKISGYSREQAKEYLLQNLENDLVHEKAVKVLEYQQRTKDEADTIAREIIGTAIQRCAVIKQGVSLKFKDDSLSIGSERNFVFGFHRLDIVTELNHHHFNRTRLVFLFADTFVKAGLDLFIFGGIGR